MKLETTKVSVSDDAISSEDEEFTADEDFLNRHRSQEENEIKRYNIGIKT